MKKESDYYNALYIFPLFMEGIFLCLPASGPARVPASQTDELNSILRAIKLQLMLELFQFRKQYSQLFTFLFPCNLLCLFFILKLTI